jgi:heme exporter protein C
MSSLSNRLPILAAAAAGLLSIGVVLALFVAPDDRDQGFSYRIFYVHVPIVLTAYGLFVWGAWKALRHLQTKRAGYDLESYVAIHLGVIFGTLTLLTGSIWAKVSWGHWWLWDQKQLVLFLVLFLFYCAYFMLRFSVEDGAQRANLSAVYALFGAVLIPVSSVAVRLVPRETKESNHPVMNGLDFHGWIRIAFLVCFVGMIVLGAALYHLELLSKRLDLRLRELREEASP